MKKLIFASNNDNKLAEVKNIIGSTFYVISLKEAGLQIDIPEPFDSLEANAKEKSATVFRITGEDCFGEDTGLETVALNGEPGVKSARYAGEGKDPHENIQKLLQRLDGHVNRSARFRTVISLIVGGNDYLFEGISEGYINHSQKGKNGFGYDAIFVPLGDTRTFAEMGLEEKNVFSHRKKAIEKLVAFLSHLGKTSSTKRKF